MFEGMCWQHWFWSLSQKVKRNITLLSPMCLRDFLVFTKMYGIIKSNLYNSYNMILNITYIFEETYYTCTIKVYFKDSNILFFFTWFYWHCFEFHPNINKALMIVLMTALLDFHWNKLNSRGERELLRSIWRVLGLLLTAKCHKRHFDTFQFDN